MGRPAALGDVMRKKKLGHPCKLASWMDSYDTNGQEGILRKINQYRGLLEETTMFQDSETEGRKIYGVFCAFWKLSKFDNPFSELDGESVPEGND